MMSGMRAPEPAPHNTSNGMEKAAAAAAAAKRKADAAAWNESHKTPKMGRSKSSTSPPSAEGAILYQAFAGALHSFSRHAHLRHTVQPGRRDAFSSACECSTVPHTSTARSGRAGLMKIVVSLYRERDVLTAVSCLLRWPTTTAQHTHLTCNLACWYSMCGRCT